MFVEWLCFKREMTFPYIEVWENQHISHSINNNNIPKFENISLSKS